MTRARDGCLIVIVSTPTSHRDRCCHHSRRCPLPSCPARQSPASHLPVVRQPIACSASRQPHTSHSPATCQPLVRCCADLDELIVRAPASTCRCGAHEGLTRHPCSPAARSAAPRHRTPHACLSHTCLSPATRLPHASVAYVRRSASRSPAVCQLLAGPLPAAILSLASRSASPHRCSAADQGWPPTRYQRLQL